MMEIKMPPIMGKAPNIVGTIAVEKDQFVSEGQVLANVETGKGNRPIKVGSSGRIAEILCQEGQEVKAGQTLFLLDEMDAVNLPAEPLKTELFVIGGGPGRLCGGAVCRQIRDLHGPGRAEPPRRYLPELRLHSHQGSDPVGSYVPDHQGMRRIRHCR